MDIILASASPRRRELMKYITDDFTAVSLDCDETLPDGIAPMDASEYLAKLKAKAAAEKYPDSIIIGCDTTVILGQNILGKPKDKEQCIDDISALAGFTHQVVTGCAIVCGDRCVSFSEVTDVTFRDLTMAEIIAYAETDEPYDKAGAYAIQGYFGRFVERYEGSLNNVIGFPLEEILPVLEELENEAV